MEQNYEGGFHIERMKSRIPWDMPQAHSHNYHEIYYLLSGSRRYFIGHSIYYVEAGDLVVIPKGSLHRTTQRSCGNYERYVVYFSDEFAAPLAAMLGAEEMQRFLQLGCIRLPQQYRSSVQKLFEAMEQEREKEDGCAKMSKMCALGSLFSFVLRHGAGVRKDSAEKLDKIQAVARFISENFSREITLGEAARMACMEVTYFSKQFKKWTGFGFLEYLTQVRMQQAQELLRNSELSVGEIAELCGFSGSNYFGDVFRSQTGVSPTAFRKLYRQKKTANGS